MQRYYADKLMEDVIFGQMQDYSSDAHEIVHDKLLEIAITRIRILLRKRWSLQS